MRPDPSKIALIPGILFLGQSLLFSVVSVAIMAMIIAPLLAGQESIFKYLQSEGNPLW